MEVTKKRWGYLALAVTILLFAGIGYAFSLFVAAIETDLSLSSRYLFHIYTLLYLFCGGISDHGFSAAEVFSGPIASNWGCDDFVWIFHIL